ncbi:MAG: hypothetical protein A2Y38_13100 [Spirochaetes bacterium GWB1_59_5]|nr:MAG: hypothetical protein A2Y38_13100 [Spirochaetes bacterium GWB1_59_5]
MTKSEKALRGTLSLEVPCSVVTKDFDCMRVKLNTEPGPAARRADGTLAPQVVLMHLTPEEAAAFAQGKRYSVVISEIVEEAAESA